MADDETCGCGKPLHYTDPDTEARVVALVRQYGPTVTVNVAGSRKAFEVPRHYIALHGLKAPEVAQLAELYGWKAAP